MLAEQVFNFKGNKYIFKGNKYNGDMRVILTKQDENFQRNRIRMKIIGEVTKLK